jgi:large conductance mechanosensitive channel
MSREKKTRKKIKDDYVKIKEKGKGIVGEFKEFALRGNVMDLAIGVVIGAAFSDIVKGFVADIIMPFIGLLTGGHNFQSLELVLSKEATIKYGDFIQTIINFFIIAASIFLVIKFVNKILRPLSKRTENEPDPLSEADILLEIRDILREKENH